jgi:transposase
VRGRKRHLLVDTLGLLLAVAVTASSLQDRPGGRAVLTTTRPWYPRLAKVWADGGCADVVDTGLIDYARDDLGIAVEIVRRSDDVRGFAVLPRRWVVERSFGWLTRSRRLARDYERKTETRRGHYQGRDYPTDGRTVDRAFHRAAGPGRDRSRPPPRRRAR